MSSNHTPLLDAVGEVIDPEFRISLKRLGVVRSATLQDGRAEVVLAVVSPLYPQQDELASRVHRVAVDVLGGVEVEVELTLMNDQERAHLARELKSYLGDAPSGLVGQPIGHEEGRANPFMRAGAKTRVLGISSGKGGVGKSSVTVNLAIALAASGLEVGVLDADVYGFSIPGMVGLEREPMAIESMVVPPVRHGVRWMSMGFFIKDEQPVIWRGPMLHKALEQFLVDVLWGDLDYLLVDMPPGTGDVAVSMAQYLPKAEIFVVTTPQPAAQRVAQRSAYAGRKMKLPLRGVIENMSWFTGDDGKRYEIFGSGGGQSLANELNVPLVGQIPLVPSLRDGGDRGQPILVEDPSGEVGSAFSRMASEIAAMGPARVYRSELKVTPGR
jgi:ATP-binding protein involved in chromosome partitioning